MFYLETENKDSAVSIKPENTLDYILQNIITTFTYYCKVKEPKLPAIF